MAECIECGAEIAQTEGMETGELIQCSDCGTELEVTNVKNFAVQKAPKEQEDWGE